MIIKGFLPFTDLRLVTSSGAFDVSPRGTFLPRVVRGEVDRVDFECVWMEEVHNSADSIRPMFELLLAPRLSQLPQRFLSRFITVIPSFQPCALLTARRRHLPSLTTYIVVRVVLNCVWKEKQSERCVVYCALLIQPGPISPQWHTRWLHQREVSSQTEGTASYCFRKDCPPSLKVFSFLFSPYVTDKRLTVLIRARLSISELQLPQHNFYRPCS